MLAVGDTPALADKVDGLLFLVEPDVVRKQQLAQAREQLDKLPCRLLGVIVARRKAGSSYYAAAVLLSRDARTAARASAPADCGSTRRQGARAAAAEPASTPSQSRELRKAYHAGLRVPSVRRSPEYTPGPGSPGALGRAAGTTPAP